MLPKAQKDKTDMLNEKLESQEINRKISEARQQFRVDHDGLDPQPIGWTGDESANAELLDEMPLPLISKFEDGRWCCEPDVCNLPAPTYQPQHIGLNADRKTAIALAWLRWKGIQ